MTSVDQEQAIGLGDDRQTYRYPLVLRIRDFETQLKALAMATGPELAGTYEFYEPIGHAGDDPLQEIVLTPWRKGQGYPANPDLQSFFQVFIYLAPEPEIRSLDQLVLLGHSDRISRPEEYSVHKFPFKTGSSEYMKFIYAKVVAYWADVTKAPVWKALPVVTVSLMYEGFRNWISPEAPPQKVNFEMFKGRQ